MQLHSQSLFRAKIDEGGVEGLFLQLFETIYKLYCVSDTNIVLELVWL